MNIAWPNDFQETSIRQNKRKKNSRSDSKSSDDADNGFALVEGLSHGRIHSHSTNSLCNDVPSSPSTSTTVASIPPNVSYGMAQSSLSASVASLRDHDVSN